MPKPRGFSSEIGMSFDRGTYRYALIPWVWYTGNPTPHWGRPASALGCVDLRSLPNQAIAGGAPQGVAFAASMQTVTGTQIVTAYHMNECVATTAMRNAWNSAMGFTPGGATLTDMLFDQLTTGSDPTGASGPKPLMPMTDNQLELHVGGHSLVKSERFKWGVHPHTNRVQDVLRRDFEEIWEQAPKDAEEEECLVQEVGDSWDDVLHGVGASVRLVRNRSRLQGVRRRLALSLRRVTKAEHDELLADGFNDWPVSTAEVRDWLREHAVAIREHPRRVLDATCKKYKVNDWREFVPARLHQHVPGRLPHRTTITENFTRADGTTIGNLLTWTEYPGDALSTLTNQAQVDVGSNSFGRAETDLSGSDQYAQVVFVNSGAASPDTRHAGAAVRLRTAVQVDYYRTVHFNSLLYTSKFINDVETNLASTAITPANGDTYKAEINGSTLKGYQNGTEKHSVSDSSVTGHLRCGIVGYYGGTAPKPLIDDFEAADLAAATTRGMPFGRGTAFNGGRCLVGPMA